MLMLNRFCTRCVVVSGAVASSLRHAILFSNIRRKTNLCRPTIDQKPRSFVLKRARNSL
jgi:hypothetical protein